VLRTLGRVSVIELLRRIKSDYRRRSEGCQEMQYSSCSRFNEAEKRLIIDTKAVGPDVEALMISI
jgi:hypothetical protein